MGHGRSGPSNRSRAIRPGRIVFTRIVWVRFEEPRESAQKITDRCEIAEFRDSSAVDVGRIAVFRAIGIENGGKSRPQVDAKAPRVGLSPTPHENAETRRNLRKMRAPEIKLQKGVDRIRDPA